MFFSNVGNFINGHTLARILSHYWKGIISAKLDIGVEMYLIKLKHRY